MTIYGAVELGGTKTDVAFGTSPADMSPPQRIATTGPDETFAEVFEIIGRESVAAIGVACFGPLRLSPQDPDFGTMLATPKPGWSGVAVYRRFAELIPGPVVLDTDVNGAAVGEGRWGAAQGMSDYVYMTVGTGIGAGVVVRGQTVRGQRHPEAGHVPVARQPDDRYEGGCPYHGDCLEGLAAGPALEARFGSPEGWAGNDTVVDLATSYVARGVVSLVYAVAPERVIVGGGVSSLPGFHERLRHHVGILLGGYPDEPDLDLLVSRPGLGDRSGLAGALAMAADVVS
ncbi:MAG TPA: ROK family protein [Acidimicrobiia bacterium]|nr:ROK family protein [Acidimicrobiia bacterium]